MIRGQSGIAIDGLCKTFLRSSSAEVRAVDQVTLNVEPGEMLVLLGPSGCGKTTLLRCIAGLEHPTAGKISLGDQIVYSSAAGIDVRTNRRDIPMIFQSYALWPHMTVADNVGYPLSSRGGRSRGVIDQKVRDVLKLVGLEGLLSEHPGTLSGGQQQRVSLARALVTDPSAILFDEPLSNIDAQVRTQLRREIRNMHQRVGFAGVYVTHDQEEALSLATRIAVMDAGRVAQLGTPREVYELPVSKYVAQFVGRANVLTGNVVARDGDLVTLATPAGSMALPASNCPSDTLVGDALNVILRPEDMYLERPEAGKSSVALRGRVTAIEYLGSQYEVVVSVGT